MKLRDDMDNNLLAISEGVYNEKINNHSASKSGREVNKYGPKRIVHPSKYNASPYVNEKSSKYPVSTRMIQLHDVIVTLSLDENFKCKSTFFSPYAFSCYVFIPSAFSLYLIPYFSIFIFLVAANHVLTMARLQ